MLNALRKKKTAGFVVTAELLLVTTILAIGLIAGMAKLRDQTIAELADAGSAIGSINQSYTISGTNWNTSGSNVASVSGFAYNDIADNGTEVGGDGANVTYFDFSPTASSDDTVAGEANLQ